MSQQIGNKSKEKIISNIIQKLVVVTRQDDSITNCGGNSETCQDDNIAVLCTDIVFISCTKSMSIYAIAQMTIIDLVALGCIPWHSAPLQGTQLHSMAFDYITRHLDPFSGTQLQLG
jgi:hypothetical protein